MKKPRELQSWLKNLNLQNNKQPLENLRLCSEHSSEECFTRENGTVKLREGSIPTLFHAPKHQKKCIYCNVPKTNKGDRIFHKFPLKNSVQLQKWLSRIPLQNFFPTKDDILCSDHFKPDCFRRVDNNKLRLRALAVPTVFKPELPTKINVLSSKVEATAAASFEKSESAADMETTVDSETAVYIETDADMDTTIDVDSTRDMVPVPIILSTSTDRPQKRRPNTPVSIYSMRHDHHYEASPRSYKRKLTSALSTIKKLSKECKLNKQRVKRLTTKISSLKDIVRTLRESISYIRDGKLRGYVNVGSGIETCDDIPLAKEALVFMAVALDGRWKIPLGYFLCYKSPLRRTNEFIWQPQILADIEYLKGITNVEGKEMWKTKRRFEIGISLSLQNSLTVNIKIAKTGTFLQAKQAGEIEVGESLKVLEVIFLKLNKIYEILIFQRLFDIEANNSNIV
ncbi:hypothetical protein DBV15_12192, partial [Temnothorax longispinosus]